MLCNGCYEDRRAEALGHTGDDELCADIRYRCGSCSEIHHGLPAWGAQAPGPVLGIPVHERTTRVISNDDLCVIDDRDFFIRGCLEIPILVAGRQRGRLSWGVWSSLSEKSFQRVHEIWNDDARSDEPPFFGWISTQLPTRIYPDTLLLKSHVYTRDRGTRPLIVLEPTDHPLAVQQREGVSLDEARMIARTLLADSGGDLVE
jgi:hypothetical protein